MGDAPTMRDDTVNRFARRATSAQFFWRSLRTAGFFVAKSSARKTNFVSRFNLIWFIGSPRTNISLSENRKLCIVPAIPPHRRGAYASSRTWRRDAVDALATQDERRWLRTAKACGPGAPTLAL